MMRLAVRLVPGLLLLVGCDAVFGDDLHYRPGERRRPHLEAGRASELVTEDFGVQSHRPADGAVVADVTQPIRIAFSAEIDAATVAVETARVRRSDRDVAGSWSVTGSEATFTPALPWALAATITVELTAAVRGSDGRALAPATFAFRVRDGAWTRQALGPAWNRTDVSLSPGGRGAVIWANAGAGVFVKTLDANGGWSEPARVSNATSRVLSPSVAINDAGHVVAAYREATVAFARRTLDGVSWSGEAYVGGSGAVELARPELVLTADDRAFGIIGAYRTRDETTTVDGFSMELGAATLTPHPISAADGGNDADGRIALYDGKALVTWQEQGAAPGVWLLHGVPDGERLQLSAAGAATAMPALAASDDARAVVVAWEQTEGATTSIWATRRIGEGAFEAPRQVSSDASEAHFPALSIDARGHAHLLWEQASGPSATQVYAAELAPDAEAWSAPQPISTPAARAIRPRIAVEPGGNAIAAWVVPDAPAGDAESATVVMQRFIAGAGYQSDTRFEFAPSASPNGAIEEISLAIDASGRALASFWDDAGAHLARFE